MKCLSFGVGFTEDADDCRLCSKKKPRIASQCRKSVEKRVKAMHVSQEAVDAWKQKNLKKFKKSEQSFAKRGDI